jgi:acyl-coenzyme A synthetase/AMP-(fatty) acid ligase
VVPALAAQHVRDDGDVGEDASVSAPFALLAKHGRGDAITRDRSAAELLRDAAAVAAELAPARRPGEQVLVLCHDRYHFACALLAALSQGLVVALPPSTQPEMIRALRQQEAVRTVLHDQDEVPGLDVRDCLARQSAPAPLVLAPIEADREIVVVYTSGSTGTPLRCPKTALQLLGEAEALASTFSIGVGDHVFATVPPHHIYGLLFGLLVPLVSGASFVRETSLHAAPLAAMYAAERANVLVSVPAHLRGLEVLDPDAFAAAPRRVFSSGAALPEAVSIMLAERFDWRVTEVLGSSETGGIGHRTAITRAGQSAEPFVPLPGVVVREGDGGRMEVTSPFVDASAPVPYVSADRIVALDGGRFAHLGRADGVVKVGGTRVSLQEIEARLLAIPGVTDACAWAVQVGGARGHETRAVVAGKDAQGRLLGLETIRRELLRWLEPVVLPRRVRVLDALPREPTGKLRRDVLEALFEKSRETEER